MAEQTPDDKAKVQADAVLNEDKRRLLQMSEIGIWLDGYDDIFSDFDPRPYSERALSDDFLSEAKKAAREKTFGTIGMKFLIPTGQRNVKLEEVIKKRLHEHFRKHHHILEGEIRRLRRDGLIQVAIGMAMMMLATRLRYDEGESFLLQLLFVMLEPGGWFITWFGFDQLFGATSLKKPDLDFYSKMSHCEIHFIPI
jgi:hypothetical protein